MPRVASAIILLLLSAGSYSQEVALARLLSDPRMKHAAVSFYLAEAETGRAICEHNPGQNLVPASTLKLVTSAAALEMLGPDHSFRTLIGYTGTLNKRTGKLNGDIVIRGEGDPALGSENFKGWYGEFLDKWAGEIRKAGIKSVEGKVITDDSWFDFQPVPAKWLWEDAGNYYGAGAFGLSAFDNTYEIHLTSSPDSSKLEISKIVPDEARPEFMNWLVAAGTSDEGYVFAAPYSTNGWLAGTVPSNLDDFILKASISDPPRLIAGMLNEKLIEAGIDVSGTPSTVRLDQRKISDSLSLITVTASPPLSDIIRVLNHKSINLYAEHLLKELGKEFAGSGTTASGIDVVRNFIQGAGIDPEGMFIEDGSGLSPLNAVNAADMVALLRYMKLNSRYFPDYLASLPGPADEGTLKSWFSDPVFISGLKAKSGSMTRVRSYAGYLKCNSGKELAFSIIVNDFSGPSRDIIAGIREILRETLINN